MPPITKVKMNAKMNSKGVLNTSLPLSNVASQQKIWTPLGTAIAMLEAVKKLSASRGRPVANMWWTHRPKASTPVAQTSEHQRQIAEHRPAREGRDHAGDHADRRQEDDVDFRMAEEPEQMLPQQHVAALGRVEEMRADEAVKDQRGAGDHDRRHREDDKERSDQHATRQTAECGRATCRARAA